MARPPVFPVEDKFRIVLSVISGEMTVAEAARRGKVTEQSSVVGLPGDAEHRAEQGDGVVRPLLID